MYNVDSVNTRKYFSPIYVPSTDFRPAIIQPLFHAHEKYNEWRNNNAFIVYANAMKLAKNTTRK